MAYPVRVSSGLLFDTVTGAWVGAQGADGKEYLCAGLPNAGASVAPVAFNAAGTTTNDNAVAGRPGEFISSSVPVGSAVALTSGAAANVTSISLTAGDWDVGGVIDHGIAATTSVTQVNSGISLTSATLAPQAGGGGLGTDPTSTLSYAAMVPGTGIVQGSPLVRISLAATATVYLVAQDTFTIGTISAYGTLRARRAR